MSQKKEFSVTVTEMMECCDISRRTVYDWVKKGVVRAQKSSAGLMIHQKDVEYLSSFMSVRSVAKKLNVPYPYLLNLIRELNALEEPDLPHLQGKYYITRDWVNEHRDLILDSYEKSKGNSVRKNQLGQRMQLYRNKMRLFDFLNHEGVNVRLLSVEPPLKYIGPDGVIGYIEKREITGQSRECVNAPYMGYGGSVGFRFAYENLADEINVLDELVFRLGEKNIYVYENHNCYNVICRFGLIPFREDIYKSLAENIFDGSVWEDGKGNIVLGDYEIRVKLPIKYRQMLALEDRLNREDLSINNWFLDSIEKFIKGQ